MLGPYDPRFFLGFIDVSDDELIPERSEVPLRIVPPLLWVSIALLIAFAALGFYSQTVHEPARSFALLAKWESGFFGPRIANLAAGSFGLIMVVIPSLSALVMLWIAFLTPRWSDRALWSAAMIFTADELALDVSYLFHHHTADGWLHTYPRAYAVTGLVAYGGWLLVIQGSSLSPPLKRVLSVLCVLALLLVVAYPAIDAYTRVVDTLGSVLFAGFLFTLGIVVAQRVGVDLLSPRGAGPTGDMAVEANAPS